MVGATKGVRSVSRHERRYGRYRGHSHRETPRSAAWEIWRGWGKKRETRERERHERERDALTMEAIAKKESTSYSTIGPIRQA